MSKKINSKVLSITLVLLLAIVVITQLMDKKKGERTFKKQLFDIDTAKVTSVLLYPKINNFTEVKFERKAGSWSVIKNEKEYNVNYLSVENLLQQVNNLSPTRLAAKSSDKWEKYELSDSLATHMTIMSGDKKLGELYVGKFNYNPQTQNGVSYVRIDDEDDVYAVIGFLQSAFDQDVNAFRYNKLIVSNKANWTKLQFIYPADSSLILEKGIDGWMMNGGVVDSTKTETYLNGIVNLNSRNFVADNLVSPQDQEVYKLIIEGSNFSPVEIKAYIADEENGFYITSNTNPGAVFSGIKGGLSEKVFKGPSQFK